MNGTQKGGPDRAPADVVRSIPWTDCDANRMLTQKTRLAVRDAVISTQEKRTLQRRNLGFAVVGFLFMVVLLGPAIWNTTEDLLGEERLLDLPTQLAFLIAMLLLAMLAALIAVWKGQHHVQHDRGGSDTFPPIEK